MNFRIYQHKLILIFIAIFFSAFFISLITTHTIAIDVETSEIINSKGSAIAESESAKLNESAKEKVFALYPIHQGIDDANCIFVKTEEGIYSFQSSGNMSNSNIICGLYLIAKPEYYIELEFLQFDISCSKNGLLSVIDGWELSGQFFPGVEDHPIPRNGRFHEFCGHIKPRKIFKMSQNVGLIEYRIPNPYQGFVVRVKFVENPKPCNAVVQDLIGIYTIRNYGRRINCTVSILLEASFKILSMNIGQSYRPLSNLISLRNYVVETGIIKKCAKRGSKDFVELRGGNGLDPHLMSVAEDMCGVRSLSFKNMFTVSCPHTAVRLVSSGHYDNLIEFGFTSLPQDQSLAPSLVCSPHLKPN